MFIITEKLTIISHINLKIKFKAIISLKSFKNCESMLYNKNKVGGLNV